MRSHFFWVWSLCETNSPLLRLNFKIIGKDWDRNKGAILTDVIVGIFWPLIPWISYFSFISLWIISNLILMCLFLLPNSNHGSWDETKILHVENFKPQLNFIKYIHLLIINHTLNWLILKFCMFIMQDNHNFRVKNLVTLKEEML